MQFLIPGQFIVPKGLLKIYWPTLLIGINNQRVNYNTTGEAVLP
jgi:hypothetical protein